MLHQHSKQPHHENETYQIHHQRTYGCQRLGSCVLSGHLGQARQLLSHQRSDLQQVPHRHVQIPLRQHGSWGQRHRHAALFQPDELQGLRDQTRRLGKEGRIARTHLQELRRHPASLLDPLSWNMASTRAASAIQTPLCFYRAWGTLKPNHTTAHKANAPPVPKATSGPCAVHSQPMSRLAGKAPMPVMKLKLPKARPR